MIYLDTHVVAWLYGKGSGAVPAASAQLIEETDDIRISPMVRLELQYLFELDRVSTPVTTVIDEMAIKIGLRVCDTSFVNVINKAEQQRWTRDPFDRIIVAQAAVHQAVLITKDTIIHDNYPNSVWNQLKPER